MNRDEILNWLLQKDNPPVRLLTLKRLLHRPETDPEVQETRSRLMEYSVTQGILAHSDEFWGSGRRARWSFKGEYWNTIYLGHFLADGHDPRIAPGVEALLEHEWTANYCMTACMLTAFRRLGYGDHPHVVKGTQALAERLLEAGGIPCGGMNYSLMTNCYMCLPKYLFCFGEVPAAQRSVTQQAAIDWIVQELASHQVYIYLPGNLKAWKQIRKQAPKRGELPPGTRVKDWIAEQRGPFVAEHSLGEPEPKRSWTRFGFPLNYNSDVLEAMLALAAVGTPMQNELEKPLQVIVDKRTTDGMWRLDKSYNGQMWVDIETKGEPSKWITAFALIVLGHFKK